MLAGAAAGAGPAKPKHKTVIGQVQLGDTGSSVKSIGRTPDNDIVISHPQVSSKHALLHRISGQLFLEDRASANGTYVRGQRIPAGQRVAVQNGEKVFIGPMPLLLQVQDEGVAVVVEDVAQWAGGAVEIDAWDLVLRSRRATPVPMKRWSITLATALRASHRFYGADRRGQTTLCSS